ncbi:MAG: signal peptidase I [Cyanobacteriota bacterium]
MSPEPSSPPQQQAGIGSRLRRDLLALLAWVLVALALRALVVEPRWIPSGSMLPTLQLQDRVLVEKLRPRLQRPLPVGTVVVFRPPPPLVAAGYDPEAALIKRVVAGPGDRVEVRGGGLWRNGEPARDDWAAEPMAYSLGPVTLAAGTLLVLGDNRNASLDSHLWGPLPQSCVLGTAIWRYWPLDHFGPIDRGGGRTGPGDSEGLGYGAARRGAYTGDVQPGVPDQ